MNINWMMDVLANFDNHQSSHHFLSGCRLSMTDVNNGLDMSLHFRIGRSMNKPSKVHWVDAGRRMYDN